MIGILRPILFAICAIQVAFAFGFFVQLPAVSALWPFPGTTPLTYIFVASIFAAAAASTFWATASGNYGALAGIFLDYFTILTPLAIVGFRLSADNSAFLPFGILCAVGSLSGLALMIWSMRIPVNSYPPMPSLVRWSFVAFVLALLIVSTRLILQVPNAIPWTITPDISLFIGWIFLGAATYFAYALLRPSWLNSAGQLCGFLAYDIVLIVPFVMRLPTVSAEHRLGLYIYTAVVTYSGLLAIYYLFVNAQTRVWNPRAGAVAREVDALHWK
jgi:hypothetical protein